MTEGDPSIERMKSLVEAVRCRNLQGVDYQTLLDEMHLSHDLTEDQVCDLVNEALDRGYIYEPLLGVFKVDAEMPLVFQTARG